MLRIHSTFIAACLVSSFANAQKPAVSRPSPTIEEIKKVWHERQEKVKTLKMSWKRETTQPHGSMDRLIKLHHDSSIQSPQPPRDVRLEGEGKFFLSEDRFRFDSRGDQWDLPSQSPRLWIHTALFDGKDYRSKLTNGDTPPVEQGAVQSIGSAHELQVMELKPIWMCTRGESKLRRTHMLDEFDLSGRTISNLGQQCIELVSQKMSSETPDVLLLAADNYRPLRYTRSRKGRTVTQLDIQ